MGELAQRARADTEATRRAAEEYERTRPPSQIERLMADAVGRVMGLEFDPKESVRDLGWKKPYYVAELDVAGLTFVGHFLSDTNGLHRTSAPFTVRRRVKGLLRWRTETRQVDRIGDLDGWLEDEA